MEQMTLYTMGRAQVEEIARLNDVETSGPVSKLTLIKRIEQKTGRQGNENWISGSPTPWLNKDGTEAPRY